MTPYFGVSGFNSRLQVEEVLKSVPQGAKRKLMVGVLVDSMILDGIQENAPKRYPAPAKIAEIFFDHPLVFNVIDFKIRNPDRYELLNQMLKITELGGKNMHGIQLNIAWPDPEIIAAYKEGFSEKQVILQCSEAALEAHDFNPEEVAQYNLIII